MHEKEELLIGTENNNGHMPKGNIGGNQNSPVCKIRNN